MILRPAVLVVSVFGILCLVAPFRGSAAADDTGPAVVDYSMEIAVPGPDGWSNGEIHLYAVDDGGDMAEREAEGKAAMLARFPGAVEVRPGEVTAAFKLFPTPVRWQQPSASWFYNADGVTPSMPAADALQAIQEGAAGWNNAGGSGFHFDYLGATTTATGCNGDVSQYGKDGKNVVGWGHIVGGFLGYSCHWRGPSLVPGTPYFAIEEIDIIFEPLAAYSANQLQALALHEFGHALGLDHTEPSACPGKVMCAGVDADDFTEPQPDDINGVIALYGVAPEPTPTPTPPGNRPYRAFGPEVAKD
ncbi:MAG: matrixin family metalloprotease [Dehalococcoidia bacterium]